MNGPPPMKRQRADGVGQPHDDINHPGAMVLHQYRQQQDEENTSSLRTSSLPSPTMQLTGHKGSVYSLRYSPSGNTLLSTSFDTTCLLWNSNTSKGGAYENYNVLKGHKNAVLDACWLTTSSAGEGNNEYYDDDDSGGEDEDIGCKIVTCSADKTCQLWDAWTGQRIRKYQNEHTAIINSVSSFGGSTGSADGITASLFVSVSDDGTGRVWDVRTKRPVSMLIDDNSKGGGTSDIDYPILAVTASASQKQIFTAGIDNLIHCWDLKMTSSSASSSEGTKSTTRGSTSSSSSRLRKLYSMKGHADTVTSLAMHPDGTHILSQSMDQTLRSWDIRPFVDNPTQSRLSKTFPGAFVNNARPKHSAAEKGILRCCWNRDGTMVSCGSSDKYVHIYDVFSTEELYVLPGHKGCVNTVTFHPKYANIVASGSSDKHIFVGELS